MKMRRSVGLAGAALFAIGAIAPFPGSNARAAEPDTSSHEACLADQASGKTTCYRNADALMTAVTGEPSRGLTNADLATPEIADKLEAGLQRKTGTYGRSIAPAASYVNAIFYDGTFGTGASLNMVSQYQCDTNNDVDVAWNSLTPAWRNRFRSGVGYGNCDYKIWDNAGYSGASYGWTSNSPSFGAMDAAAESVKMR